MYARYSLLILGILLWAVEANAASAVRALNFDIFLAHLRTVDGDSHNTLAQWSRGEKEGFRVRYLLVPTDWLVGGERPDTACEGLTRSGSESIPALLAREAPVLAEEDRPHLQQLVGKAVHEKTGLLKEIISSRFSTMPTDVLDDVLLLDQPLLKRMATILWLNPTDHQTLTPVFPEIDAFRKGVLTSRFREWLFSGWRGSHALLLTGLRTEALVSIYAIPCDSALPTALPLTSAERASFNDFVPLLGSDDLPVSIALKVIASAPPELTSTTLAELASSTSVHFEGANGTRYLFSPIADTITESNLVLLKGHVPSAAIAASSVKVRINHPLFRFSDHQTSSLSRERQIMLPSDFGILSGAEEGEVKSSTAASASPLTLQVLFHEALPEMDRVGQRIIISSVSTLSRQMDLVRALLEPSTRRCRLVLLLHLPRGPREMVRKGAALLHDTTSWIESNGMGGTTHSAEVRPRLAYGSHPYIEVLLPRSCRD